MKSCKLEEQSTVPEESEESHDDFSTAVHSDGSNDKDLDDLIEGLKICETKSKTCKICCQRTKPNKAFVNLYKCLVDNILDF